MNAGFLFLFLPKELSVKTGTIHYFPGGKGYFISEIRGCG